MMRVAGIAAFLLLVGCAQSGEVEVRDVWARSSANLQDAGAIYMTIDGGDEEDRLVGVQVGQEVAAGAQLHQSMMMDDQGSMMQMHAVEFIAIDANGTTSLEPGSYHVMLVELAESLVDGSEFDLTLSFEKAGHVDVTVEVRER